MTAPRLRLQTGTRFAILALSDARTGLGGRLFAEPAPGFLATSELPLLLPDHWKERLGTLAYREIDQALLYLITTSAEAPEVDGTGEENLQLKLYRFYVGLMISTDFFAHGRATLLTGEVVEKRATITGRSEYPPTSGILGAPAARITLGKLARAARIAAAIERLATGERHWRVARTITAFLEAARSRYLDEKVHQYLRVVEGFVHTGRTRIKKTFSERSQFFTNRHHKALLDELWDIRSVVEHLRGPYESIAAPTERERRLLLIRRGLESEVLARYCLTVFLETQSLLPVFEDALIEDFWRMPEKERRKLWQVCVDVQAFSEELLLDHLTDVDLGLS